MTQPVAGRKMAAPPSLSEWLERLEQCIREARPALADSFRPGAGERELRLLSTRLFRGRKVSPLLEEWFRWHDGQKGDVSFSPERSEVRLLSVREAVDTWETWKDEEDVWEGPWVPLVDEGEGFFLFAELNEGRWTIGHFDLDYVETHPVSPSLYTWVRQMLSDWKEYLASRRAFELDWEGSRFEPVEEVPGVKVLERAPVGSTWRVLHTAGPEKGMWSYYTRLDKGLWVGGQGRGPKSALGAMQRSLAEAPQEEWELGEKEVHGGLVSALPRRCSSKRLPELLQSGRVGVTER
jgi:hypothetical protein